MINEVWKDIEGYEGLYQVSNLGRVKSLERIISDGRHRKERILKPYDDGNGYLRVELQSKPFKLHRLVAQAFIPNPDNLPFVNHKDENPKNNRVFLNDDGSVDESNLEWCDNKYNINYGTTQERRISTKIEKGQCDQEMCDLRKKDKKEYHRIQTQRWRRKKSEDLLTKI